MPLRLKQISFLASILLQISVPNRISAVKCVDPDSPDPPSMARINLNRCSYAAKVLLLGLLTAQALSTIQVYLSNADLHQRLTSIKDAGYLIIPNQQIMHILQEFSPAFFGGLFFTLTVGASLSLISFAAAWVWVRLVFRNRLVLVLFMLLWAGCLIGPNRAGFSLMVTCYFFFIPPVVFVATLRWAPEPDKRKAWLSGLIHFVPVVFLALLWASQLSGHIFVEIRDSLLLSNALGRKINNFYYDYTFYPAEVFKSLNDKTLKTCNLEHVSRGSMVPSLEKALRNYDYLNVGKHKAVDLEIAQEGSDLLFRNKGRMVLRVTVQDFFSDPGSVLKEFSIKSDQHAFFRQFTFFSLLLGFPLCLYVILQALTCIITNFFLNPTASSIIATILCLLFGIALLVPLHVSRAEESDVKEFTKWLESERWQDRVAALKLMPEKGIDVGTFRAYQKMRTSRHIPERYWLARALGTSRLPETYGDLMAFLDDPSPNVVSMAFYALGKRGDTRAIEEIVKRIQASNNWYNQWYAYKALRNLKWKQTKSKQGL
jgi:hypothetical protein